MTKSRACETTWRPRSCLAHAPHSATTTIRRPETEAESCRGRGRHDSALTMANEFHGRQWRMRTDDDRNSAPCASRDGTKASQMHAPSPARSVKSGFTRGSDTPRPFRLSACCARDDVARDARRIAHADVDDRFRIAPGAMRIAVLNIEQNRHQFVGFRFAYLSMRDDGMRIDNGRVENRMPRG